MEKEERRKKIIARGNDRLALITGKIQKLETDQIPKSSSFNAAPPPAQPQHVRSSSESVASDEKAFLHDEHRRAGDDADIPSIMEHVNGEEVSKGIDQRVVVPNVLKRPKKQKSFFKPDLTNLTEKYLGYFLSSISLKEINFSIITTEDIRVMCTIVLAVMVVLYHVILPQNARNPESLIARRPMYVLLLTDIFIVATRLAPFAHKRKEEREPPQVVQEVGDGQDWGGAIRLMELGLVLHQTVRALFIDLSFYVVIVVCGLTVL